MGWILLIILMGILWYVSIDPFENIWSKNTKREALDLLGKIDAFCVKHDLKYFIFYGTLLGQERHGGFIPWDDDIDICMEAEDLEFFKSNFNDPSISIRRMKNKPYDFYKLYRNDKSCISGSSHSWPFIDIFPAFLSGDDVVIGDFRDSLTVAAKDIFPLKRKQFEDIDVLSPNNFDLSKLYGEDWRKVCVSSAYNHRLEEIIPIKAGTKRMCSEVI